MIGGRLHRNWGADDTFEIRFVDLNSIWEQFGTILDQFGIFPIVKNATHQQTSFLIASPRQISWLALPMMLQFRQVAVPGDIVP